MVSRVPDALYRARKGYPRIVPFLSILKAAPPDTTIFPSDWTSSPPTAPPPQANESGGVTRTTPPLPKLVSRLPFAFSRTSVLCFVMVTVRLLV